MKISNNLIIAVPLIAAAEVLLAEEMAEQGTISLTTSYNAPYTAMPMGKDLQLTFDAVGVGIAKSESSPFNHSSVRILGSGLVLKGAYTEAGSIVWTLADGDQVFATYEGRGAGAGKLKGKVVFIGGTGKFAAITGGGELERTNVPKPAMKGTVQGFNTLTGSWTLKNAE